jgi:hypothetical protein
MARKYRAISLGDDTLEAMFFFFRVVGLDLAWQWYQHSKELETSLAWKREEY